MEFAFSTNAFKKYSLKYTINSLSEIGYRGIEILCDVPHAYPKTLSDADCKEIKQLLLDLQISISNLNAFTLFAIGDTHHPSWIENDSELRNLRIEHTIDCIKLARKLGVIIYPQNQAVQLRMMDWVKMNNSKFLKTVFGMYYLLQKTKM